MSCKKQGYARKVSTSATKEFFSGHSVEFEDSMRQILGKKASGTADLAGVPTEAKRLLRESTKKLSVRVDEIVTMDTRLRELLVSKLDSLQQYIRVIDKTPSAMDILGILYNLLGILLGYDWMDCKVYRTPIYYRTKSQEFADYRKMISKDWDSIHQEENVLVLERRRLCLELREKGMHINQVARVLNTSEYEVNQYLKDANLAKLAKLLNEGYTYDDIVFKLRDEDIGGLLSILGALSERRKSAQKRLEGSA
ncbi:MAG: hypothetical protein ABSB38_09085 [Dehalococcoidia bacterium]